MRCASADDVRPIMVRRSRMSVRPSCSPITNARPPEGNSSAAAMRIREVLPAPFGPRITQRSSNSTCQSTGPISVRPPRFRETPRKSSSRSSLKSSSRESSNASSMSATPPSCPKPPPKCAMTRPARPAAGARGAAREPLHDVGKQRQRRPKAHPRTAHHGGYRGWFRPVWEMAPSTTVNGVADGAAGRTGGAPVGRRFSTQRTTETNEADMAQNRRTTRAAAGVKETQR